MMPTMTTKEDVDAIILMILMTTMTMMTNSQNNRNDGSDDDDNDDDDDDDVTEDDDKIGTRTSILLPLQMICPFAAMAAGMNFWARNGQKTAPLQRLTAKLPLGMGGWENLEP